MGPASSVFDIRSERNSLTISFSSTLENIDRADVETRRFLNEKGLQDKMFAVCLVMREGMINAVAHGNCSDPGKRVRYRLTFGEGRLVIEIEDQGDGFDWQAAGKKEPKFDSDHGRGLAIIKRYSTSCAYNSKGNKLSIVFEIEKERAPMAGSTE